MKPFHDETLLARWLSGELTDAERRQVEDHPDFPRWKRIAEASRELYPPAYDGKAAWQNLQERRQTAAPTRPKWRLWWSLAVTAAVVAVGLFFWYTWLPTTLVTGNGEQLTHTLPDGSVVRLNAESHLQYRKNDWGQIRRVHLEGEAFFDVTTAEQPFVVHTASATITVLGTRFNVQNRTDHFSVYCNHGQVRVQTSADSTDLVAGESAVRQAGNRLAKSTAPEAEPGWMTGTLRFVDLPAPKVFAEIARQFPVTFTGNIPQNLNYRGQVPLNDLDTALSLVCESLGLTYTFVEAQTVQIDVQ